MPSGPGLSADLTRIMREDRGRMLSALIAALRDFDLAEDALSDAVESALTHWARAGLPDRPEAWLIRVARRKAIDRLRRTARWKERLPDLAALSAADEADAAEPPPDIPDERLRLIFTCCHPAIEPKSRVALTLRTLGGLTTGEIARAFLDGEAAMGQRLSRAKARIAAAGIPFAVPVPEDWPERLNSVLAVLYLIFNEGYAASAGEGQLRRDLCEEAIWLARLLDRLAPGRAETEGLLSLMLTTHARAAARAGADGALIPLDAQDRGHWDRGMIGEGLALLDRAMARGAPGPYQIKAAIGALHVRAPSHDATDWPQMVRLYGGLFEVEPSPVVLLNRAVALAESGAPEIALAEIAALERDLAGYQPFHAARAELLARTGDHAAAEAAFSRAIALSGTRAERDFLRARQGRLAATAQKKGRDEARPSPTGR